VTHATPYVLRITRLPVGRRASGFVLVAKYFPKPAATIRKFCGVTRDLTLASSWVPFISEHRCAVRPHG
jgi:hypothetical protein